MTAKMTHDALDMIEYGDIPALLVLADSERGLERARRSAETAGCRVSGTADIDGALDRLDRHVAADAVLVDVEADHGDALDRLLDRLEIAAMTGRHGSIVIAPPELTDPVFARASHADVHHLCEPDELERAVAIGAACARRQPRLHDIDKRHGPGRLQQLSEEVGRIATILATLSGDETPERVAQTNGNAVDEPLTASAVRAIIRARRIRDRYFHAELFADPAWDMLLDLMAARLDGQRGRCRACASRRRCRRRPRCAGSRR